MHTLVENLRLTFNQKFSQNVTDGLYHPADLDRLMVSDKYAQAFLRHQKGVAAHAADMCDRALRWRKEYGVNELTDSSFPDEMLNRGAMFFRNQDKDEHPILYFKIKDHKKNAATLALIQRYMVYLLDREDRRIEGRQVVVLFDMSGAGVSNLDLDLIKFLITCFEEYFPDYLAYLLVFDMPWILNAAWKIIKTWLSEEARSKVIFVRGQEIFDHIDKDNLFVHMGGTDDYTFKYEAVNGNVNQNHLTDESVTSEERKHVTFSSDDPTVFTSLTNDSEEISSDPGSPTGDKNFSSNNHQLKTCRLSKSRDDTVFFGSLITIQPGDELVFTAQSTCQKDLIYQACLILTNPRCHLRTAYKVKTTSPEKYKVRPSLGMIKPGQTADVVVYLTANTGDVSKDKFLVMAMEIEDGFISSGELAELWRTAPKGSVTEHRLRCCLVPPERLVDPPSPGGKLHVLESLLCEMGGKLDCMTASHRELERQMRGLRRGQRVLMVLLMCLSLLILALTYQRLTADPCFRNKSMFSCFHP